MAAQVEIALDQANADKASAAADESKVDAAVKVAEFIDGTADPKTSVSVS